METAEKPTISVMPMGVVTAVGEDLRALNDLRDKLASKKYDAFVQNPEYTATAP